jgi:RNA polymerase sigma factor (sigma-70 family)
MHEDQYYIKGLAANNSAIIQEIYKKYAGKVKAMIVTNNGTEDDAADIFQDALTDIYRKATSQEGFTLTSPLEAFIIIICKNKWLTQLEKNKRRGVTFKDPEGFTIANDTFKEAEVISQHEAKRKLLVEKFDLLQEGCKSLLQLSWSGMKLEDVAEKLKVTYGYVRKKKSECLGKLTELIKSSGQYLLIKN